MNQEKENTLPQIQKNTKKAKYIQGAKETTSIEIFLKL